MFLLIMNARKGRFYFEATDLKTNVLRRLNIELILS
jgi:hypothetical protein